MNRILNIFRNSLHIVAVTVASVVLILYIILHYNLVGILVDADIAQKLSEKLQTRAEVGQIEVTWTNQIALNDVVIFDQKDDTLFAARRAMVALEVIPLLQHKLVVNTVQLIDFHLQVRKDSTEATPNYAFIIETLMPKQQDQQRRFINDISLNALLLRQGTVTWDVLDHPRHEDRHMPDPSHLHFENVSAGLSVEVSHITGLKATLKRMSWTEACGISLHEMKGQSVLVGDSLAFDHLLVRMSQRLEDGTNCELELKGKGQTNMKAVRIELEPLDIEAGHWGNLHADIKADLPIDSLSQITYMAQVRRSFISDKALDELLVQTRHSLPDDAQRWLSQIRRLEWNGYVTGHSDSQFSYKGHLSTTGQFSSSLDVETDFDTGGQPVIEADVRGKIASVTVLEHSYRDLSISAQYNDEELHTDFSSNDPLCELDGKADLFFLQNQTLVQGYIAVGQLSPHKLHLTDLDNLRDLSFRGLLQMNVAIPREFDTSHLGFDLNHYPSGLARIDSLSVSSPTQRINLGSARLTMMHEQESTAFALASSVANVAGTQTSLFCYIPSNPEFAHLLQLPGQLDDDMTLKASWDTTANHLTFEVNVPQWSDGDNVCSLVLNGNGATQPNLPIPTHLDAGLKLEYRTPSHTLQTDLALSYDPSPLRLMMSPSTLTLDGKTFSTSRAVVEEETAGNFRLSNMLVEDDGHKLEVSGLFGQQQDMDLKLHLDHWQLDFFLDMLHKGYLDFGGYATGDMNLLRDSTLQLKSYSLIVDDFSYIGTRLGRGDLSCFCDLDRGRLRIAAEIESAPKHLTYADCDVRLHEVHDSIDLRFQIDSLPLDFVSYWIGGAVQDLHGFGTGDVRVFGDCDSLNLEGHPLLQNVNFTHSLLGARFYVTDTLNMVADAGNGKGFVGLNNVTVRDRNGQKATMTLDLEHQHLHDMEYGLDLDIPETSSGFLLYDHPNQTSGDIYWGRLWATGRCQMHGTYSHHRISLQMSPAGRSVFNLSPGEEDYTDNAYSFLTFRDKQQTEREEEANLQSLRERTFLNITDDDDPTFIEADLLVHANEHCQVNVQLDPLAEDRLVCRGTGDLALHYDSNHDINLTGNYDISSGSYTVNMRGDLMTKAFQMQPGSRVTFPGSPSDAELSLKATYSIPSANLRDLDESFASLTSLSRTTLPVDCKLNVTGPISAPQTSFDLEVKNTSDDVQALVHNIIGTQEMLNREVFYLLLFSKFYTPEYASTSQRQTGSELTSFASSSLTSQLNNLLGHMSDNFTLGTNFRSDKGDFSDMEMDVSVSTRLLNDRLLMTGNLGYRDPANSIGLTTNSNTFIGDFDVEFLINTRGTVRAKAYSHYNERDYSINNALTTQGIGIILRKDFKSIYDLIKRKQ